MSEMKQLKWQQGPDSIMSDTLLGYFEIAKHPDNPEKYFVDLWNDYGDHETFDDKLFSSQQEAIDFCQSVHDKNVPIAMDKSRVAVENHKNNP